MTKQLLCLLGGLYVSHVAIFRGDIGAHNGTEQNKSPTVCKLKDTGDDYRKHMLQSGKYFGGGVGGW